jgi:hypothetical protein
LLRYETKRSEIQVYFFAFFRFFLAFFRFFAFFAFFRFKFFASLRFSNFRFEAKRGGKLFALKEAKFNIFRIISLPNFVSGERKTIFTDFFAYFRFASIFSLNFCLYYLRFRFRFLVFRIEVNHVKEGFFFASKRNEIFASISIFASEAKVRAHPKLYTANESQQPPRILSLSL